MQTLHHPGHHIIKAAALLALLAPAIAPAGVTVSFGSRDGGAAGFDDVVKLGGGTPSTLTLGSFGSASALGLPGGITITRNNGENLDDQGIYSGYNTGYNYPGEYTTGNTIDISPRNRGDGGIGSGVTFSFAKAVNSFGFEVGDWGTCCQPSALYMSFDDGAPIQVGLSKVFGDTFATNDTSIVFVGAFDDSKSFSKVQFWGDGYGEYLVVGGTLRSANLDFGTIGTGESYLKPLLPVSIDTGTGGMNFGFAVAPNERIVIDPDVAVGYTYELTGGPLGSYIASAEFEFLGDSAYDIYDLSGNLIFDDFLPGLGNIADFVAKGYTSLQGFRVEGIDQALMLNPSSTVAFKTGLTFGGYTGTGNFTIKQTPQTVFVSGAVPEPASWAMMALGFGLTGMAVRRRRTAVAA